MSFFSKIFGDTNARAVQEYAPLIQAIAGFETAVGQLGDQQLRERVATLRTEINGDRERLQPILPEMFALTREAAKRALGQRHYDVQLIGGVVLHEGKIAEMKTGEGKTLVATLPLSLNALAGKGAHLVTVNDYLAKRDAGWMGQVYARLGLTCAAIVHEAAFLFDLKFTNEQTDDPLLRHLRPINRQEAYAADITYGTNNEFGFDYLRDNMAPDRQYLVQRDLFYAIVDEVDSILVDEARTPLIISAPVERSANEYRTIDGMVKQLAAEQDFKVDEKTHSAYLNEQGIARMEKMLNVENIYAAGGTDLINIINQALKANSALFQRDKQYVVRDGEIVIVDEFTGRLMFGRRYSEGLHQAIEAKEGVEIKQESQTLATITFQNLFRLYNKLAGMTGTAATEAEEFHKIYNLDVVVIPTNRPMVRQDDEDSVYKTERGKFQAVVREISQRHEQGQPVLAGTISIAKNEILSDLLTREGVPHQVLNAKNHEREAHIIAQAGKKGAVTIATNMAGRGVDIILGGNPPSSAEQAEIRRLGGLHVIGTERHESRRIDLQLRGRSGRQGDPGSSQFFVSMEDDLMRIFGSDRMKRLMDRLGVPEDMPLENKLVSRSIESAQKKVEGHNFDIRKHLVEYDDVMNKHREVVYRKRLQVLEANNERLGTLALGTVEQEIASLVSLHTSGENRHTWNLGALFDAVAMVFAVSAEERSSLERLAVDQASLNDADARNKLIEQLETAAAGRYREMEKSINDRELFPQLIRNVMLRTIDTLWIEHLDLMERLREGIGLRGYGQREPLVEYKREAFQLFTQLMNSVNEHVALNLFRIVQSKSVPRTPMQTSRMVQSAPAKTMSENPSLPTNTKAPDSGIPDFGKIGRNDPCPCGSGKKFKKCYLAKDPGCKLLNSPG